MKFVEKMYLNGKKRKNLYVYVHINVIKNYTEKENIRFHKIMNNIFKENGKYVDLNCDYHKATSDN